MAKVYSVYFPKGGVGKTTLAFNMARHYALKGLKVLAIGLDDQGSLTSALSPNVIPKNQDDLLLACHFAMRGKRDLLFETIMSTDLDTLKFIPETPSLRALYSLVKEQHSLGFLKDNLIPLLQDDFDLIIFDCPPAQSNALVQSALVASDLVVMPYSCQVAAVNSWQNNFSELMAFMTKNNPECAVKIVANNSSSTNNSKDAMEFLGHYFSSWMVGEPLLRREEVEISIKEKCSVSELRPNSVNTSRLSEIFTNLWES